MSTDRWPPAVSCYDCTTMSKPTLCSDPFNRSLTSVPTISCDGACTKWLHKPGTGSRADAFHFLPRDAMLARY